MTGVDAVRRRAIPVTDAEREPTVDRTWWCPWRCSTPYSTIYATTYMEVCLAFLGPDNPGIEGRAQPRKAPPLQRSAAPRPAREPNHQDADQDDFTDEDKRILASRGWRVTVHDRRVVVVDEEGHEVPHNHVGLVLAAAKKEAQEAAEKAEKARSEARTLGMLRRAMGVQSNRTPWS